MISFINFKFIVMKKLLVAAMSMMVMFSLLSFVAPSAKDAWNVPAKYKAMKNKKKGDAESIKLGKTLYAKNCKSCHGMGKGDGPKAASMKTKMDDFTSKEFKALPDGDKYYMSFVGRGEMPNFEKKIPDEEERWAIVSYLDTL
jgi:mono/diheme cytochrome c family protein